MTSADHKLPELRQLRYFLAVAEELHFGRAAQRLHMTQPPLSQAIQALEQTLGATLFIRSTRQISLTAAGNALIPEAQKLLQQAQYLPELMQGYAAGTLGQLSLAFVSIADYSVLPPLLRQYRTQSPGIRIALREATTDVQLQALEAGEIDAGFLIPPLPEHLQTDLHYRKILNEALILAAPDQLLPPGPVQLAQCAGQEIILFPRRIAPALHDAILSCFAQAGLTPVIGQEAIQMQTIVGLVSAGMGIALVPQSVANLKRPGVVYHALLDEVPPVEIGIAWRKDNHSAALAAFLQLSDTFA